MAISPPQKPPDPPRPDELDALIEEARRRQRKRRLAIAATAGVAATVAAAVILAYSLAGLGGGRHPAAPRRTPLALASTARSFAVGASAWHGRAWSGLVIVKPRQHRCVRVPLPQAWPGYLLFSGARYAYAPSRRVVWVGKLGSGAPRKLVLPYRAVPVWVGAKLGLLEQTKPRLHVGGRTTTFDVPGRAVGEVSELSSSHGRLLFDGTWGNGREGELHAAIFVSANGRTREVRVNPMQFGADSGAAPAWSPDGKRIAFFEDGDLWTMAPDGSGARRLTHTPGVAKHGPLLWSADGRTIVYDELHELASHNDVSDVYAEAARGGTPTRLTHSEPPGPNQAVDQLGTKPLTWAGPSTLAVLSGDSIGLLALSGGAVEHVCTVPGTGFTNATVLPD